MNKKIIIIIILLFSFTINTKALDTIEKETDASTEILKYKNQDTSYEAIIDDKADLLTSEEENKLLDQISELTNFGNIIFVSTNYNTSSAQTYANNYYYNHYGNNNGSLFLIDMDNRKIIITSGGNNYGVITTAKANIITDNIYKLATNKEYYECSKRAFEQINTLLNNGKIAEPMRYISNAVLAISLSALISFMIVYSQSKLKNATIAEIIKKSKNNLLVNSVTGTKTGTERIYSPVESSSGGGSSGGGSSGGGGGFSGGGGGHSF